MSWEQPSTEEPKKTGTGPVRAGIALFVVLTVAVLLCYVTIFVNPQILFNPFPPPVAQLPTATKAISVLQTPTVPPTSTPQRAFPATWTPTATPPPTLTFTPRPTSTPSPTVPPTSTPGPLPQFTLHWDPITTKQTLYPNASGWWSGVAGEVADKAGQPVIDVTVKIWDDFGHVWETTPGDASAYAQAFKTEFGSRGTYAWWEQFISASCRDRVDVHVQIMRGGVARSRVVTVRTSGDCEKNLILIHFQKNY